ncbi:Adenylosuccinate lyase [Candidatus Arthromitus sp. SFB-mouse-SU]|uniref:adenylosuccinate lyase n=1 Tax=Candidatus Arthromitus sp. SFB-mouse TaxID=49118 RepID=UPI000229691A|nr:adenylosuccinate lyase [Candidatus Arthromitus sp. SFB-mouse]EIA22581.1 Adenylosuccinate lyase [Candidatus Arthromitus sp. SFB-2]EIA24804.1 Adenylosuccinate lyase [Candidatus Arthromitus sp. SFB-1]EIA25340.1 Adenylosuccinate lyase [Candidatus Arthromitus sp. SFB-4]EIA28333.1 Adenylosuccinate lyase [Candidatus Arthromitus sp. SFB-co]EIA29909.1 Adenylosuccinate lyase [Candidatus Arthromitus sp. SFB-mouse-SU]EIA31663.1 Adenylosuccinate lyase [Candidatus Arthromitus sp. SFB-5]
MIERYSRKEMLDVWSNENKFNAWMKVELLSSEAFSKLGVIPKDDIKKLWENCRIDVNRMLELEKEMKHDVVAFTRALSEYLGEEKKWVHYGLTSTDVVDTAYGYILKQANEIIIRDIEEILEVLSRRAIEYKGVPCIGRTHGVHADITSFGLKFALWYDEMRRNLERFKMSSQGVEIGKISGAVGNYANIDPFIQDYVCDKLGINSSNISTQTLQRDRHAFYISTISLIGSTLEKIGIEIRHLHRTEVREVEERFSNGQKGSSAMPHKRNPISSENISGCARVLRGYMITSFENIQLWHERDISHSSAERIILPDATILVDYMLNRMKNILDNLVIFKDNMLENINRTYGIIFSQRVMNSLINKGLSREDSYDIIQTLAMHCFTNNLDFKEMLLNDSSILKHLTPNEIEQCFTIDYYMKNVDVILRRVGILK